MATDSIVYGEGVNLTGTRNLGGVFAGQDVFAVQGDGTIYAWCIDIFHFITPGVLDSFTKGTFNTSTTDRAPTPHTLTQAQVTLMVGLMAIGNGILENGGGTSAGVANANAFFGTNGDANEWSAAIQLAIWNAEYPASNFMGTAFDFNGGPVELGVLCADLNGDSALISQLAMTAGLTSGLTLLSTDIQNFGYVSPQITLFSAPVPEPGSFALMGSALIGLGVLGWYRRRKDGDITGAVA